LAHQVEQSRSTPDEAVETGVSANNGNQKPPSPDPTLTEMAHRFLADLWQADAKRGAWQAIHSLEGSLLLWYALEGPEALVALARTTHQKSLLWSQ
jgi:hypothetical protein